MASPVPGKTAPRLFISYSHDSREHEDRVRALADRLRQDGIDAVVDQYDPAPPDGWPMWMDREIQKADFVALVCTETYLKRVEGRELPGKGRGVLWEATIVYNRLNADDSTIQRFIPILFDGDAPSCIPWPVRGVARYQVDSEQGYEDFYRHLTAQPRHKKPAVGKLKSLPAIQPQSYPASLESRTQQKTPTSLDRRNRLQMLKRVRLDWIDGVLKQSLYQVARIELELQTKSDAVEQPLKAIVQIPDQPSKVIPVGTTISQVFAAHGSTLLILGAPGTGKTTFLLELAEQLLNHAEHDEGHPIPVVFNLSSWAVQRLPLREWLITELNERSDVPKTLAKEWVEADQIIPLLDGLDEVAIEHRQACAEAINDFRRDHGLLPIAVCSRITDYEALGTKLRLRSAVLVIPLTKAEIRDYLEKIGQPLHRLREALENDSSLWELLETPLMLWVAMLAYRDAPVEFSGAGTFEQQHRQLFANFVGAMFNRRAAESRYIPKQAVTWLCWLASQLRSNEQTVFYLENLIEEWLPTRTQRWLSKAGMVVCSGLIGGLTFLLFALLLWVLLGLNDNVTESLVFFGLIGQIGGSIGGLIGAFMKLRPVETIQISLVNMASRLGRAVRVNLIVGLFGGLVVGLVVALISDSGARLTACSIGGLIGGSIFGGAFGVITLLSGEAVEARMNPNQGTRRSIRTALATGMIYGLTGGLILGLGFGLSDDRQLGGLRNGLFIGSSVALILAIVGTLAGGGLFALKHLILRLMLWRNRSVPLRYVRFLNYAAERLFLRKVGGGYIFMHRTLLEYFASLQEQPQPDRKG